MDQGRGRIIQLPPEEGRDPRMVVPEQDESIVPEFRRAAVLLLLHGDCEDPNLIFILRSERLRDHAGQIALPGGKCEASDASLESTALREAEEEVGLPRESTRIVGRLRAVPTPTRFVIVPFVAWAPSQWQPRSCASEVDKVVPVRLSELLDPNNHRVTGTRRFRGIEYTMHEFQVHDPPLWGATARIVWDFLERIDATPSSPERSSHG